jgi:predicted transcriptional regulator
MEEKDNFKPSVKNIIRISDALKKGTTTKTQLAHDTKLNYTRLVKHIVWMEKKGFIKTVIVKNKIKIDMTENGKEFSSTLSNNTP